MRRSQKNSKLLSVGLLAWSVMLALPASRSLAQATIVNVATNATDPSSFDDSEPSIAVNPLNPLEITIVTFGQGFSPGSPGPVYRSFDGGATWITQNILQSPPSGDFGPYDQKIDYNGLGLFLYAGLADFGSYIWR